MNYKAIAFDLDDTLIDTTNELIPFACRKIHSYLLTEGYKNAFEDFDISRKEYVKTKSHKEFFKNLVTTFPLRVPSEASLVVANLNRLFYEPDLPPNLALMPGAEDNLKTLGAKYEVFVVTAGVVSAQHKKLAQLKIERFIKKENILVVAEGAYPTKRAAFEKIVEDSGILPEQLLSIGNRLSQEIRMAKQIGAKTCYYQHGEHAEDVAQDHFEIPDYTIHTHKELISACQL
tara:strand:- start:135795 stop:136490 length:696 start_codon:yes stop_codon:yes gene_type:complete